jgi:glucokinase
MNQNVPIFAQNDVNAGTIGEYIFGAGRGVRDFVYLAAGTGLAGGAVLDGQLMNGARGFAMEVGHVSIDPQGRACNCGGHGCVEMYCSGKGLVAGANAYLADYPQSALASADELRTRTILDAARAGDPLALRLIDEAGSALGVVIAWSMIILAPPLIVIGGGLGNAAYDLLMERAQPTMLAHVAPVLKAPQIVRSQVEVSALGAAALVWHGLGNNR